MTTNVKIQRVNGNGDVLVEVVDMTSGGPTTTRSHTLTGDQSVEVGLHNGACLHVSEQPAPAAVEPAPAKEVGRDLYRQEMGLPPKEADNIDQATAYIEAAEVVKADYAAKPGEAT